LYRSPFTFALKELKSPIDRLSAMKNSDDKNAGHYYFDRDISWLSFNERVLDEAQRTGVPLMERIRYLGIYSSNLDEFYRVRMPALMALEKLNIDKKGKQISLLLEEVNQRIVAQQKYFGSIIEDQILHALKEKRICLLYKESIPNSILEATQHFFIHSISAYLKIIPEVKFHEFFPENNKLYILVTLAETKKANQFSIVTVPSYILPRFYTLFSEGTQYIVFLDDIIKSNLGRLYPGQKIIGAHSFKTTRDAEMDLQDEFIGNLAKKIEQKISQRDFGSATRFLHEPGLTDDVLKMLKKKLNLKGANFVKGGAYHNLKDLLSLPLKDPQLSYEAWPCSLYTLGAEKSIFEQIRSKEILLHPPYHTYDTVLRFFNEASIDPCVEKIYITLYRIASDSRIGEALISAAQNGKKVTVFVELKARFDEANNIRWSKRMKAAGVRIIESIPGLKVHAKLALVKRKNGKRTERSGLIATGNFNEGTARYYTDHILMTGNNAILKEVENVFQFLKKRKREAVKDKTTFKYLLVGQFNLQQRFLQLIDREISNREKGLSSSIIIKLNNLEDRILINKLYEASQKGVSVQLIVRSICCLVPGITGMSENISVQRIVDRYLEHGRVFIFNNAGNEEIFIGSSDWMNRNIYRRIEVCVPIQEPSLKKQLIDIIQIQLSDNYQAVSIDPQCANVPMYSDAHTARVRSQEQIGKLVALTDQPGRSLT
jgi:polyphosphate kinase